MLDLLEKNRGEDLHRLVTAEYVQDKMKTLETDFKIRFEERFDFFDQLIKQRFAEIFDKCTSVALSKVSKQQFEDNFEAMRIDLRDLSSEVTHAIAMAEFVYSRAQEVGVVPLAEK